MRPRVSEAAELELFVVSDPEIMGGLPVIRGTRIPVHLVADMIAQGATEEEILSGYPTLTAEDLTRAVRYAAAHPPEEQAPAKHPLKRVDPLVPAYANRPSRATLRARPRGSRMSWPGR